MKKMIAIILCLVVSASMLLCGCDSTKSATSPNKSGTSTGATLDASDIDDLIDGDATAPLVPNEFTNESNFMYDADNLSIKPKHLYWENDTLIAECFVTNGKSTMAHNIQVKRLAFGNEEVGIFADASFGPIDGLTVAPYGYTVWTFKFGNDCVFNPGADLSTINWESSVSFSH